MSKKEFTASILIFILVGMFACGADGSFQWPGSDSSGASGDVATTSGDTSSDTTGDVIINVNCSDSTGGTTADGDALSCVLDTDGDGIVNCNDTCWKINNPNQGCDDCVATCSTRKTLTQGEQFQRGDIIVTCGTTSTPNTAKSVVYLNIGESHSIGD